MQETITINSIELNLNELEKDCWRRIFNGSLRSKDPLHNPAVANVNDGLPVMRTVVLRNVIVAEKMIFFRPGIYEGWVIELRPPITTVD
ncbi:MAG: hypothetical protein ACKVOM_10230 [Ferruginibacter sp.]